MNRTSEFSFYLKPSLLKDAGIGVFATHDIAPEVELVLFEHKLMVRQLAQSEIPPEFISYCVATAEGDYICPESFSRMEMIWYINHSNEPNIGHSKTGIQSLRLIKKGEEIFIDYNSLNEPPEKKERYY